MLEKEIDKRIHQLKVAIQTFNPDVDTSYIQSDKIKKLKQDIEVMKNKIRETQKRILDMTIKAADLKYLEDDKKKLQQKIDDKKGSIRKPDNRINVLVDELSNREIVKTEGKLASIKVEVLKNEQILDNVINDAKESGIVIDLTEPIEQEEDLPELEDIFGVKVERIKPEVKKEPKVKTEHKVKKVKKEDVEHLQKMKELHALDRHKLMKYIFVDGTISYGYGVETFDKNLSLENLDPDGMQDVPDYFVDELPDHTFKLYNSINNYVIFQCKDNFLIINKYDTIDPIMEEVIRSLPEYKTSNNLISLSTAYKDKLHKNYEIAHKYNLLMKQGNINTVYLELPIKHKLGQFCLNMFVLASKVKTGNFTIECTGLTSYIDQYNTVIIGMNPVFEVQDKDTIKFIKYADNTSVCSTINSNSGVSLKEQLERKILNELSEKEIEGPISFAILTPTDKTLPVVLLFGDHVGSRETCESSDCYTFYADNPKRNTTFYKYLNDLPGEVDFFYERLPKDLTSDILQSPYTSSLYDVNYTLQNCDLGKKCNLDYVQTNFKVHAANPYDDDTKTIEYVMSRLIYDESIYMKIETFFEELNGDIEELFLNEIKTNLVNLINYRIKVGEKQFWNDVFTNESALIKNPLLSFFSKYSAVYKAFKAIPEPIRTDILEHYVFEPTACGGEENKVAQTFITKDFLGLQRYVQTHQCNLVKGLGLDVYFLSKLFDTSIKSNLCVGYFRQRQFDQLLNFLTKKGYYTKFTVRRNESKCINLNMLYDVTDEPVTSRYAKLNNGQKYELNEVVVKENEYYSIENIYPISRQVNLRSITNPDSKKDVSINELKSYQKCITEPNLSLKHIFKMGELTASISYKKGIKNKYVLPYERYVLPEERISLIFDQVECFETSREKPAELYGFDIGKEYKNCPIFLLVENNEVKGYLIYKFIKDAKLKSSGIYIELKELCTGSHFKGKGIAKILLDLFINKVFNNKAMMLQVLNVKEGKQSASEFTKVKIELYGKYGFKIRSYQLGDKKLKEDNDATTVADILNEEFKEIDTKNKEENKNIDKAIYMIKDKNKVDVAVFNGIVYEKIENNLKLKV